MEKEIYCCHKTKERPERGYKSLINRLNRVEGQVREVKSVVEKDVYCTDILVQVATVDAAPNSFSKELLASHIRSCVVSDIRGNREEIINELVATIRKLMHQRSKGLLLNRERRCTIWNNIQ